MKGIVFSCFFLLLGFTVEAQKGYKIDCKISNIGTKEIYMAYHLGSKQYLKDTAKLENGVFSFQGDEPLESGVYLIAIPPSNTYFEMLIDQNNQFFQVETDSPDYNMNMKVMGSEDNRLFYEYIQYLGKMRMEAKRLSEKMQDEGTSEEEMLQAQEMLDALNKQVTNYQSSILEKPGNLFVSKLLKANQEIKVPEPPVNSDGSIDSTFRYRYYKAHYFDNLDLADDRLLRTPVLEQKVMTFIDKMVAPLPDSLIKEIDIILETAEKGEGEVFRFLLSTILNKYASSKIMGHDAVYVHLALKYYANKDRTSWVEEEQREKIIDNAKKLDPLLIGKKAPNLELTTLGGKATSLYNLKSKFVAVYFWDPDCGNCSKMSAKLVEVYKEFKSQGLEIFGICNKTYKEIAKCNEKEKEKQMDWINTADPYGLGRAHTKYYIQANPTLYLLDENKVIRYKRIDADQLRDILNRELADKS
ncbi:MAG: redoxin domain-containing protein [Flammeovirgaceae bacterium]